MGGAGAYNPRRRAIDEEKVKNPRLRGDLLSVALVVAVVCLWFYPATLLGRRLALIDDTLSQQYPFLAHLFALIRGGRLDMWSPEIFMGYPLATSVEPHLFSPANWPFLLFDPHRALTVKLVGMCCASAAFRTSTGCTMAKATASASARRSSII